MTRQSEALHTLKMAMTTLGILFLGVSVFAYAWGGTSPWPVQAPLDRYIESGTEAGTRMLERDLAAAHPSGSDAATLLARLRMSGMSCDVNEPRPERYSCTYRAPRHDRFAQVAVAVSTEQGRYVGEIASMVNAPR
jgi:hypothetical protein